MATQAALIAKEIRRGLAAQERCDSPECGYSREQTIDYSKGCEPADHWENALGMLPNAGIEFEYKDAPGEAFICADGSIVHLATWENNYPMVVRGKSNIQAIRAAIAKRDSKRERKAAAKPKTGGARKGRKPRKAKAAATKRTRRTLLFEAMCFTCGYPALVKRAAWRAARADPNSQSFKPATCADCNADENPQGYRDDSIGYTYANPRVKRIGYMLTDEGKVNVVQLLSEGDEGKD